MSIPVYVINTPGDEALFEDVAAQVALVPGFSPRRAEGVLGRTLPDLLCLYCTRDPNSINNKGALGVFLAHMNAWEAIAAGEDDWGIVLEDDVEVLSLNRLAIDPLPADFDLIFINDRTSPDDQGSGDSLSLSPIIDSLPSIERRNMAVGGDGYVLHRRGAHRLLDCVREDLFFSHVDLRMLAYCLSRDEVAHNAGLGPVSKDIVQIARITGRERALIGYAAHPFLVRHKHEMSRREREDRIVRARNSEAQSSS